MRRLMFATAALALAGCAHLAAERPVSTRSERAEDVWVHDGRRARHAIVEPEPFGGVSVVRVIWSDPAPRPGRDLERELRWVFAGLEPSTGLRLEDRVVPHPDGPATQDLSRALDVTPPDVEQVVAGLPRLARLSSRGALLARAAAVEELHPASFEALFDALTTGRARHALGPGPDGIPAGGSPDEALLRPLVTLAARPEVGPPEAKKLIDAAGDLPASGDRAAVLLALLRAPLAPVDAQDALKVVGALGPAEAREVLLEIATRLPLSDQETGRALELAMELPMAEWRQEVAAALKRGSRGGRGDDRGR